MPSNVLVSDGPPRTGFEARRFRARPLDLKSGSPEEIVNEAVHRFGSLAEDPMSSIFNELQLSLITEVNARLRHLSSKSMVLCAPEQERRHCDPNCIA